MSFRKLMITGAAGIMTVFLAAFTWNRQGNMVVQAQMTPQDSVEAAIEKLEQAESMRANLVMDLGVEVLGLEMDAQASMDLVTFASPLRLKSDVSLDLGFLGDGQAETYACEENGKYFLYTKNRKRWTKQEVEASELSKYNGQLMMKTYLEQIEELEAQGKETLRKRETYKYAGVIHKDGLQKILLDAGCLELLAESFQGSVLKPVGTLLTQEEKTKALMKKAEDMEVTVWIDAQTGYPVQCSMDVGRMLSDAFGKLTGGSESKNSRKDIWSRVEITRAEIVIRCSEFNDAEEFEIAGGV